MFYNIIKYTTIITILLLSPNSIYAQMAFKDPAVIPQIHYPLIDRNKHNDKTDHIDSAIKTKQILLQKTKKTDTKKYISLYDEIAELIISKNKLLTERGKADDIDRDKICSFASDYAEVEFVKTRYYKTPFNDNVAKTLQNIAEIYEQCYPPMAEKYLKPIIKIKEAVYGKESAEAAKAYDMLGDYYRLSMADFNNAIEEYKTAKSIRNNIYKPTDPRVTENYERLAKSLFYHGDKNNDAERLLLSSISIRKKAVPSVNFPLYRAYMDIGMYYSMKSNYAKSIIYLNQALQSFRKEVNGDYIAIVSELSQIYLSQDDLDKALNFSKKAYYASKEFYGSDEHYLVSQNLERLKEIKKRIDR